MKVRSLKGRNISSTSVSISSDVPPAPELENPQTGARRLRVAEIGTRINCGSYSIPSDRIAAKLIEKMSETRNVPLKAGKYADPE